MRELSLFTGYGGLTLGLRLSGLEVRTIGYCEIDPYCQEIIQARIRDGFLDDAPIWADVRSADFSGLRGMVDIVTAGFPCQPHSTAGRRLGAADERDLWPDTRRVIRDVGAQYVLLENAGIELRRKSFAAYAYNILADLAADGYDAVWSSLPAAAVGAPHLRWRWWCLAYANGNRRAAEAHERQGEHKALGRREQPRSDGGDGHVAPASNADCGRELQPQGREQNEPGRACDGVAEALAHTNSARSQGQLGSHRDVNGNGWWFIGTGIRRVDDGSPNRLDRVRTLGNGVLPAMVQEFLRRLG